MITHHLKNRDEAWLVMKTALDDDTFQNAITVFHKTDEVTLVLGITAQSTKTLYRYIDRLQDIDPTRRAEIFVKTVTSPHHGSYVPMKTGVVAHSWVEHTDLMQLLIDSCAFEQTGRIHLPVTVPRDHHAVPLFAWHLVENPELHIVEFPNHKATLVASESGLIEQLEHHPTNVEPGRLRVTRLTGGPDHTVLRTERETARTYTFTDIITS